MVMVELLGEKSMKRREFNGVVPQIPNDVIYDIMLKLPFKSLMRFQALSEYWKEAITNRQFFKQREIISPELSVANTFIKCYYYDKLEELRLYAYQITGNDSEPLRGVELRHPIPDNVYTNNLYVYSESLCDGLLGFVYNKGDEQFVDHNFLVWNPFTGQHKEILLPKESNGELATESHLKVGFGYDATIDDYKIVVIFDNFHNNTAGVMVRTLKCDEWRAVYFAPSEEVTFDDRVVAVDGDFWWIGTDLDQSYVLIRFHLAEEKFSIVAWPPKANHEQHPYWLHRRDESLYLIDIGLRTEYCIWKIIKQGNATVWELVHRILVPLHSYPYGFTCDGALVVRNYGDEPFYLYACISSNGNLLKFELQEVMDSADVTPVNDILLYGETLISL